MSRKRSQGSRTPPTHHVTAEEEGESPAGGIANASATVVDTARSITTDPSTDEGHQGFSVILSPPVILVAAKTPTEINHAQANTDPERPRRHERGGSESARRWSSQNQGVQTRRSSTNSDFYDREEPLLTKRNKVYRKRGIIPNPAVDESDDSILGQAVSPHTVRIAQLASANDMTDVPQSEPSERGGVTESSSSLYSSSGTIIVTEGELMDLDPVGFQLGNLPPHMRLQSGLAFIYMAIPPDGGFGWVVLVLSFLAQLVVDGIIFSIGILLPAMEKDFKVRTSEVAMVASIQIGCYFLGGAFSSALINSYGFRPVAMMGVAISALALMLASFSPNLSVMIILYSVIVAAGGPGLSMIWVSSQLIIGFYFERYRALASGFSCSGAGAGILIFSITNNLMEEKIGWRNTVRFHAALVCLLFFVSMAYLEVKPSPVGVVHRFPEISSSSSEYYGNFYVHNFLSEDLSTRRSHPVIDTFEPNKKTKTTRARCRNFMCPCCAKLDQDDDKSVSSEVNYLVRPDPMQRDDLFYTGRIDYKEPHRREQIDGKEVELVGTETHLQSAAYGLHNIHNYNSSTDMSEWFSGSDGYVEHRPVTHKHTATPVSMQHKRHVPRKSRCWLHQKILKAMNRLFDWNLLKSFEFCVLLTSAFLYPMGFNIPFLYSKMRTTIPTKYAQMIGPAIGTSNFIIRILCGFVAYKLRSWTNYICGGGMVLGGLAVLTSAFFGSDLVWFQILYGLCYGVAPAVFATLRAIIYVRYLGLSKLTTAFGITALVMGAGVFIGTTLGSVMVESSGGFMAAFAFAGLCIIISGMLKLILPVLIKARNKRLKKRISFV